MIKRWAEANNRTTFFKWEERSLLDSPVNFSLPSCQSSIVWAAKFNLKFTLGMSTSTLPPNCNICSTMFWKKFLLVYVMTIWDIALLDCSEISESRLVVGCLMQQGEMLIFFPSIETMHFLYFTFHIKDFVWHWNTLLGVS